MAIEELFNEYAAQLDLFLVQSLAQFDLSDSNLARGIRIDALPEQDLITIIYPDYGFYVNSGRRAGARQPPTSAILEWLMRRNIRPLQGQSLGQLAYIISVAIAMRGIPPREWLDTAINSFESWFLSAQSASLILERIDNSLLPLCQ